MLELGASVVRIVVAVGIAYVLGMVLIFGKQARYVYYPDEAMRLTPANFGLSFEDLTIETVDGERIHAWYVPATDAGALTLLFSHGNGGNISTWLDSVQALRTLGFNVMIYDYRGYGSSTGSPDEEGTYQDIEAVWKYLVETRGLPGDQIVLYGRSLGGAVTAWLAARVKARAVVLESTFTSAPDMAAKMFPYFPVRLLCRFKYDTLERVKKIESPLVVAHSTEDEMIPFSHGKRIFEEGNEPKMFVEMLGWHNSGGLDFDRDYATRLKAFLNETAPKGDS